MKTIVHSKHILTEDPGLLLVETNVLKVRSLM